MKSQRKVNAKKIMAMIEMFVKEQYLEFFFLLRCSSNLSPLALSSPPSASSSASLAMSSGLLLALSSNSPMLALFPPLSALSSTPLAPFSPSSAPSPPRLVGLGGLCSKIYLRPLQYNSLFLITTVGAPGCGRAVNIIIHYLYIRIDPFEGRTSNTWLKRPGMSSADTGIWFTSAIMR